MSFETEYRAIARAIRHIRIACNEIEESRRPDKILEWLCDIASNEVSIREICSYIDGYEAAKADLEPGEPDQPDDLDTHKTGNKCP